MKTMTRYSSTILAAALALVTTQQARAQHLHGGSGAIVQCPGDTDGDAVIDMPDPHHPNAKCMHLLAGDGMTRMADGKELYIFGFSDATGVAPDQALMTMLSATFPAPTIMLDEGDEFYLTLTNVGMLLRPDLFDPHVVHFHGFPQAASTFDGVPDASFGINPGSSLTYYYKLVVPGTFMYHCHVEAVEHMEMGMLGNLYVRPAQNRLADGTALGSFVHHTGNKYVYNDGDGSTIYDVEFPIQLGGFDSKYHEEHLGVQPLPFHKLHVDYAMLNGRGYPDTTSLVPPPSPADVGTIVPQPMHSLIEATGGQKILLRLSNLNITRAFTVQTTGLSMRIVGKDAKLLRGPTGLDLSYRTSSVTLGGGESVDAIIDTAGVPAGTYFFYTTNLNYLSNGTEDFGGMMTEIVIR